MEAFARRLAQGTLAHPFVVGALVLGLSALAMFLLPIFAIDPDVTRMLPQQNERVRRYRAFEPESDPRRQMFVILRGADLEARAAAAAARLSGSPHLTAVAATREQFFGAAAEAARQAPLWYLPEPALDALQQRLTAELEAALRDGAEQMTADPLAGRATFAADPLALRWLLADVATAPLALAPGGEHVVLADARLALLRLEGREPAFDVRFAERLLADVEQRLAGEQFEAFGGYAVARAEATRSRDDLRSSAIGSAVLIGLFLILSMRRLLLPGLLLATVGLAIFWALPIGGAWFGPLTPIAISAAAVLMGLGIDFGLHYSAHYARARASATHAQAVVATHAATLRPCVAAAGTTAFAFGALAFGSVEGLRGFALLLILGLAAALLATFLILPHALRWVAPESRHGQAFVVRGFLALAQSRAGRPALLAILGAVLAGIAGIALRGLELSTDPTRLRPPSETEARRLIERELGVSPQPVLLLVPADQDAGGLRAGLARLREQGSLRFAEREPGPAADRARAARVAAFRAATGGWRARAERILGDLGLHAAPFADAFADVERRLAADPAPDAAPIVTLDGEHWRQVRLFVPHSFDRIDEWRGFCAEVVATLGPRVELLAPIAWMEELATALAVDLRRAMWIAGIGCLLLLGLLLRGIGAALLAMLPAACGLALTVGALAWSGLPLTPVNFIALPMLLGIGLDDGVHLVARARAGERIAGPTAAAIWRTTATTMLGFGSLVTATSPGIAELGWLTLIGVGTCLLTTLSTLPILLRFGLEETA